jgi:malate dehydrogenase
VQQRGAAIIQARGASSAASAANGAVDTVRSLTTPTPEGDWTSVCVCSDGSYGIDAGLIASMPISVDAEGNWHIVPGVELDAFSQEKLAATVQELRNEREAVSDLIK